MKYSLAAFADEASNDLDEQIKALKENDISLLEIRGVNGNNVTNFTVEYAKEVKKRLDDNGIKVWAMGTSHGKISILDDFEPQLEKFKNNIEVANILECNHMRVFSFFIPQDENPNDYSNEVMKRLSKFADVINGSNIVLCHENEKGVYGDIAVRCKEIHSNIPQIKSVFDPANFVQSNQDTIKAFDILQEYVEYMHIKDVNEDGVIVPAGDGLGNIKYLLNKYQGEILTVEPHLAVFSGLENLERKGEETKIDKYRYSSNTEAFNIAVNALKKYLL